MATVSEMLFESFCAARQVAFERVPETTESRPDYWIGSGESRVVAEIKQIDPNDDDLEAMAQMAQGKAAAMGSGPPGERIRKALRTANRQIRKLTDGRDLPGMVVVFNNTPCSLYPDPYSVMTAMRGLDVVPLHLTAPGQPDVFGSPHPGPRSEMRPDVNSSTSAIAVLLGSDPDDVDVPGAELLLDVFHNRHAAVPLDVHGMRWSGVRHFVVPAGAGGSCDSMWSEI
jgi:hypothetical protein